MKESDRSVDVTGEVRSLIKLIESSDVEEFELSLDDFQILIKRSPVDIILGEREELLQTEPSSTSPVAEVINSPAVGVFHLAEGVSEGKKISKGEKMGFVEFLGIEQEIFSPSDGIVSKIVKKEAEAVEWGEPLFEILP